MVQRLPTCNMSVDEQKFSYLSPIGVMKTGGIDSCMTNEVINIGLVNVYKTRLIQQLNLIFAQIDESKVRITTIGIIWDLRWYIFIYRVGYLTWMGPVESYEWFGSVKDHYVKSSSCYSLDSLVNISMGSFLVIVYEWRHCSCDAIEIYALLQGFMSR